MLWTPRWLGSLLVGAAMLAPAGVLALPAGAPPPLPEHVAVADLGRSDELDRALSSFYRPVHPPSALGRFDSPGVPGQPLRLRYPLSLAAAEVDPYGWRVSASRQGWRMHTGLDLVVAEGTPVLAALAGEVSLVAWVDGYGLTLVLDHGRGWQTLYAHLAEVAVRPGARLAAGSPLGRVGSSGQASTAHLHFELRRRQGSGMVALDPSPVLALPTPLVRAAR